MASKQDGELKTVSDVWKDGHNVQDGVKLDLVQHLKNANARPEAVKMKNRALSISSVLKSLDNIQILDIGCGIGSDVVRMARIIQDNNHSGSLVGIDTNSEMIAAAEYLLSQESLPDSIRVSLQKMSAMELQFDDSSFDFVFVSCTLQHIAPDDVVKVLQQVKRVLKPKGVFVALEPEQSSLRFYTKEQSLEEMLHRVYSKFTMANSRAGSSLYWMLRNEGFLITDQEAISNLSADLKSIDPGWVKLNGMAKMAVAKSILTQEEADSFVSAYISGAEHEDILCTSAAFLWCSTKQ